MYISPDWSNTALHLMKMDLSLALRLLILILTILIADRTFIIKVSTLHVQNCTLQVELTHIHISG